MRRSLALLGLSFLLALPGQGEESLPESRLSRFKINDPRNTLELMGDFEGTTMMFKVKDPSGKTVGVFKPTSGSTYHPAEFAAAQLGKRLGIGDVFPATVIKRLNRKTLARFRKKLEKKRFKIDKKSKHRLHFKAKERNRKKMLRRLSKMRSLEGVFKAWVSPLIFYYELGSIPKAKKHPLYKTLQHFGPRPGPRRQTLKQCTKIFKPRGCYTARIPMRQLAEEFTGILLIDALLGNRDRFAGGNLHLTSGEGTLTKLGGGRFDMPKPRLVSLDNGAALQPRNREDGLKALKNDLALTRVSRKHFEELLELRENLRDDREVQLAELGLTKRAALFEKNLADLIAFLEGLETRYRQDAFF